MRVSGWLIASAHQPFNLDLGKSINLPYGCSCYFHLFVFIHIAIHIYLSSIYLFACRPNGCIFSTQAATQCMFALLVLCTHTQILCEYFVGRSHPQFAGRLFFRLRPQNTQLYSHTSTNAH